ncbi:hypothetical protein PAAG_11986 [Paracoccidioides lutzii Pb01]|uniref:Uncharacterized protein n=1 Tax=Paracoccidioides lutzii (strain ATCC MYA-826 / Pb01) TaxID=502779 RepID=A0A0A2VK93_PARBA|nr:hypothetical protein PAAG_11986 [Paracoccidioides lutzii Pb01]KGQ01309.1 hypothetical protein PAAG_11986 [Paracoccidioides lutzii Pb01]
MEFIEGCTLDAQWADLSQCQKSEITLILKTILRRIAQPPLPLGSTAVVIGRDQLLHALKFIEESETRSTYKADLYRLSLSMFSATTNRNLHMGTASGRMSSSSNFPTMEIRNNMK